MPDPSMIAAGAKAAVDLINLAQEEGWLESLVNLFRKRHVVLVVGATGAGKTNFLNSLTEELPEAIHHLTRTPKLEKKKVQLNKKPFSFYDTPGQIEHKPKRRQAVRSAMSAGVEGVVNVVCYGYHEYAVGSGAAVTKTGRPRKVFLKKRRSVEIESLYEWMSTIDASTAKWMLTVVTKADLWWDDRDAVMAHYERGQYASALEPLARLDHAVLPYCSVFHRFFGISPLCGSFDDEERLRCRAHLLTTLLGYAARS